MLKRSENLKIWNDLLHTLSEIETFARTRKIDFSSEIEAFLSHRTCDGLIEAEFKSEEEQICETLKFIETLIMNERHRSDATAKSFIKSALTTVKIKSNEIRDAECLSLYCYLSSSYNEQSSLDCFEKLENIAKLVNKMTETSLLRITSNKILGFLNLERIEEVHKELKLFKNHEEQILKQRDWNDIPLQIVFFKTTKLVDNLCPRVKIVDAKQDFFSKYQVPILIFGAILGALSCVFFVWFLCKKQSP